MTSTHTRHDELKRIMEQVKHQDIKNKKIKYLGDEYEDQDFGEHDPDCTMGKTFTY